MRLAGVRLVAASRGRGSLAAGVARGGLRLSVSLGLWQDRPAGEVVRTAQVADELYALHTGQTRERVHDDMDRDRFFTPEEALDYGLVDRIVQSRDNGVNGNGTGR